MLIISVTPSGVGGSTGTGFFLTLFLGGFLTLSASYSLAEDIMIVKVLLENNY